MNEFNSQVCTSVEQSKRLLAMGLKPETADMYITNMSIKGFQYTDPWQIGSKPYKDAMSFWAEKGIKLENENWEIIPAWSLHRLMEMLPNEIPMEDYYLILGVSFNCVYYADNEFAEVFQSFDGNTYSCIIKCVEWLIKEGYFNKEYLKQ